MKTTIRAFVLPTLLLTLTACGEAPEDAGAEFGKTLRKPAPTALIDGIRPDRYSACLTRAMAFYDDTDDQDAFFEGCKRGAGM